MSDDDTPNALRLLKREIEKFLSSDKPEVLCLRGAWGVGKTFSWRKYLAEAKARNAIALPHYAYVSLFGIESLEELKFSIFENTVARAMIGASPSIETFKENGGAILAQWGRLGFQRIAQLNPFTRQVSGPLQSLAFLSVSNRIICIDDLERRGKGLRLVDILGLTSFLCEQRNCKVVLILNDEELGVACTRFH